MPDFSAKMHKFNFGRVWELNSAQKCWPRTPMRRSTSYCWITTIWTGRIWRANNECFPNRKYTHCTLRLVICLSNNILSKYWHLIKRKVQLNCLVKRSRCRENSQNKPQKKCPLPKNPTPLPLLAPSGPILSHVALILTLWVSVLVLFRATTEYTAVSTVYHFVQNYTVF